MSRDVSLLFLGTGAADSRERTFPRHFQDKDQRRCASALLDGHILIDCGPHVLEALRAADIDSAAITDVVLTHLHSDHFHPESLRAIAEATPEKLNVWYYEKAELPEIENCMLHPVTLFASYATADFTLTGVSANHSTQAMHLSFEIGGKRLLYALDGAWMTYETAQYTRDKRYDAVVMDCTVGDYTGDYRMAEHNSIPMIRLMTPSMKALGILSELSKVVLSHLAVTLHRSYAETFGLVKEDGYLVAYDGMQITL